MSSMKEQQAGARNAREILPAEMWTKVFDNLKGNAATLSVCYKVCVSWQELLEKDKTDFLMNEVFQYLAKYLDHNSVLNCRLVSKTWKQAMDERCKNLLPNMFEDSLNRHPYWPGSKAKVVDTFDNMIRPYYNFMDVGRIDQFLTHFEGSLPSAAKAIISKTAVFDNSEDDDDDPVEVDLTYWLVVVSRLLPKFGSGIEYCSFFFNGRHQYSSTMVRRILYDALQHLPNIRYFDLFWLPVEDAVEVDMEERGFGNNDDFLPRLELKHLTHLNLGSMTRELSELLFRDTITSASVEWHDRSIPPALRLPNLRELTTRTTATNYAAIVTLAKVGVSKLTLEAECLGIFIDFCSIFANSLEHLEADLRIPMFRHSYPRKLKLPFLKFLRIAVPKKTGWFDFIISLSALERLEIILTTSNSPSEDNLLSGDPRISYLQLPGYYDRLYESNIWNFMPNLLIVKIRDKVNRLVWNYNRREVVCY